MRFFAKIKDAIMASTATKIATAAVTVAVLGGGAAGLAYAGVFTGAEAMVGMAAMNTFAGLSSSTEEVFGLETLSAALKEQGAEVSAEAVIKEIPLGDLGLGAMALPNAGFHLTVKATPQHALSAVLDAKVANTTLLTGNAYFDKNQVQVNVPKLSGSVLTLNYSDVAVEEQMKASYAAEYLGLTDAQIEAIADMLPKQKEAAASKEEIQKKLIGIVVESYQNNLADRKITRFEKAGKTELHDNNAVQKCKVYTAEMDARYFMEFVYETTLCTKSYFKELCAAQGLEEGLEDELFQPVDTAVHQLKLGMRDTIVWTFYVSEERLVRVGGNWTIDWVDEVGSCTRPGAMELVLAPAGNPFENMRFSIDTPIHYDDSITNVPQTIDYAYSVETENTEDTYFTQHYLKNDGVAYTVKFDYEKLAGDFELEVAGQEQKYTLAGVIDELEKGKSIGLELDAYTYEENESTEEQELDISFSLKLLEAEVVPLQGTQQDVLQMTEEDFNTLEEEISNNLMWMLFSMMGLFQ